MRLRKTKNPFSSHLFTLLFKLLEKQRRIAQKGSTEERKELARTTPLLDIQLILLKDKSIEVRRSLTENPNLHSIVLDIMSND